jgi:hypothetical protein
MWSFFGSGHGKGPHGGVDAVLKQFIRQVQLDVEAHELQNAEHVVAFLGDRLSQ